MLRVFCSLSKLIPCCPPHFLSSLIHTCDVDDGNCARLVVYFGEEEVHAHGQGWLRYVVFIAYIECLPRKVRHDECEAY